MFDPDPAFVPQVFPELVERFGRRGHTALADQLIELVRGGCDPMAEEQQHADFAVQVLRLRKLLAQAVDLGKKLFFIGGGGVHGAFSASYFNK